MTKALSTWLQRRRDRAILMGVDDRLLADIGITRADISDVVMGRRLGQRSR